jgi:hypothetical protein
MGKLGQWLLVGANLGILVGLILTVLQIRQSYDADSDQLAIEDVIAQYAYRWDSKDASGFAELFTEDAVIERCPMGPALSRHGSIISSR